MTNIILFEDESYRNYLPLLYTRHPSEILIGGLSNLERIKDLELEDDLNLFLMGRNYLSDYAKNEYKVNYVSSPIELNNYLADDTIIGINALISASKDQLKTIIMLLSNKNQMLINRNRIVAFSMKSKDLILEKWSTEHIVKIAKNKGIKILTSKDIILLTYPWELISQIKSRIISDVSYIREKFSVNKGDRGAYGVYIGKNTELEGNIFLDASNGPIIIGNEVRIEYGSILRGPIWIRDGAEIKTAKIKEGSVIGIRCKIGSEIECSIMDDYSNAAHYGFIGHSYVGRWVNVGAQTTFSDLKNTYGTVKMRVNNTLIDSKLLKLGPFISDYVKLSIGTLVYGGRWIGVASHIYDIVNKDIPSFTIWTKNGAYVLDVEKVVEIHKKMFKRRDRELKDYHKRVIYHVFKLTEEERRKNGIKKGYFKG